MMYERTEKQKTAFRQLADKNIIYHLFYGGARSGKTLAICDYIRWRAILYPGSKHIIFRKTERDCRESIWKEAMLKIIEEDQRKKLCRTFSAPTYAKYNNGSTITIGGLANHEIDKVLSTEYNTIYIGEASQVSYQHFPVLKSRLNGKQTHTVKGHEIANKIIVDENPPGKNHWTFKVFFEGLDPLTNQKLNSFEQYAHLKFIPRDNEKNLSKNYMQILQNLQGGDRRRFLDGDFGVPEKLVYSEFDPEKHVKDFQLDPQWKRFRGIDYGFSHPTACLFAAYDKSNEVIYIYKEYRESGLTAKQNAENINRMTVAEVPGKDAIIKASHIFTTVSDHQSEYRHVFAAEGIPTIAANKDIRTGIDAIKQLFISGKLIISRECGKLIDEIYSFEYKDDQGKKDYAVNDINDDLLDCLRYIVNHIKNPNLVRTGGHFRVY
jgi:phage terminase large subunit